MVRQSGTGHRRGESSSKPRAFSALNLAPWTRKRSRTRIVFVFGLVALGLVPLLRNQVSETGEPDLQLSKTRAQPDGLSVASIPRAALANARGLPQFSTDRETPHDFPNPVQPWPEAPSEELVSKHDHDRHEVRRQFFSRCEHLFRGRRGLRGDNGHVRGQGGVAVRVAHPASR